MLIITMSYLIKMVQSKVNFEIYEQFNITTVKSDRF